MSIWLNCTHLTNCPRRLSRAVIDYHRIIIGNNIDSTRSTPFPLSLSLQPKVRCELHPLLRMKCTCILFMMCSSGQLLLTNEQEFRWSIITLLLTIQSYISFARDNCICLFLVIGKAPQPVQLNGLEPNELLLCAAKKIMKRKREEPKKKGMAFTCTCFGDPDKSNQCCFVVPGKDSYFVHLIGRIFKLKIQIHMNFEFLG